MHDWSKMKKFTILIPVYNDWKSFDKLIIETNSVIATIKKNIEFNCVVINDASTEQVPKINVPLHLSSIEIINMKKNKGHARCNAFGIKYILEKNEFDHLILMDGDGEDRPAEIRLLAEKALSENNISVVAKRIKRSEGFIFKLLYQIHKIITILFTGKNINFGNYSCLTKKDVKILSNKASLWSSYSGTLKKNILLLNSINSERGSRYYGPSKMSLFKLIIHSFSMIAVFKYSVFLRSTFLLIAASYFSYKFNFLVSVIQILLVIFSLIIYFVSLRGNKDELLKSFSNKDSSTTYTH